MKPLSLARSQYRSNANQPISHEDIHPAICMFILLPSMGPTSPVDRFSAIALQHNYILLVGQPLTDLPHAAWFIPLHPVPSQPLVLGQRILLASPTSRTSFGQIKSIVRLEKILSGHLCRLNPLPMDHSFLPHAKSTSPHHSLFFPAASFAVLCYDWFSSPVRNGTIRKLGMK